jgi:hypothetical protein
LATLLHIVSAKGVSNENQEIEDDFPFQEIGKGHDPGSRETVEQKPESAAASAVENAPNLNLTNAPGRQPSPRPGEQSFFPREITAQFPAVKRSLEFSS